MLEFEVTVMGKTEKGLWLRFDVDPYEDVFIPDSQISDDSDVYMKTEVGRSGTIIITEWIAQKKGLM